MKKNMVILAGIAGLIFAGHPTVLRAEDDYYNGYDNAEYAVSDRPDFIFLPDLQLYVSYGSPYDMIYMDDYYYLYWYGTWYYSEYYYGPWFPISFDYLPLNIRRYPWREISRFRDFEYRRHDRRFWEDRFDRERLFFRQHPPLFHRQPGGPPPPLPSKGWHFVKPFGPGGPPPGPGWNKGPVGPPPPPLPPPSGGSNWNKGPLGPVGPVGPPPPPSGGNFLNKGTTGTPPPPPSGGSDDQDKYHTKGNNNGGPPPSGMPWHR